MGTERRVDGIPSGSTLSALVEGRDVAETAARDDSVHSRLELRVRTGACNALNLSESFNGKFRDECSSMEWFRNRVDAKIVIENWRRQYNEVRPHSSLGNLTPILFKRQLSQPCLEGAAS
jgi:hypothetical protein